jgi:hypothetical protein
MGRKHIVGIYSTTISLSMVMFMKRASKDTLVSAFEEAHAIEKDMAR